MLGVAILIGLARGIVLVMTDGMITDTLLQWMATRLQGLPAALFVNIAFAVEAALTLLVPSTSGLAALTMPVLAPLADFAGCARVPNPDWVRVRVRARVRAKVRVRAGVRVRAKVRARVGVGVRVRVPHPNPDPKP